VFKSKVIVSLDELIVIDQAERDAYGRLPACMPVLARRERFWPQPVSASREECDASSRTSTSALMQATVSRFWPEPITCAVSGKFAPQYQSSSTFDLVVPQDHYGTATSQYFGLQFCVKTAWSHSHFPKSRYKLLGRGCA